MASPGIEPRRCTYEKEDGLTYVTCGDATFESFTYDAAGNRVDLLGPTADPGGAFGEVGPQYDLSGNPILDMTTANAVQVYRVFGPGIDEPLAEFMVLDPIAEDLRL